MDSAKPTKTQRRRAKQGTVWKRTQGGVVSWIAQYDAPRGPDGKRRRKAVTGSSYGEVIAKLKKFTRDADAGYVAEPGHFAVAELVERFLIARARKIEKNTLETYRHVLTKHVISRLGGVKLKHLTPLHIEKFLEAMEADRVGQRTRRSAFDLLRSALKYGVEIELLQRNPAERVEQPKMPEPEVRALTAAQVTRLLTVARDTAPWIYAAISLGLAGLRRGEVFVLTWANVSLDAGTVRVVQALKRPVKGEQYISVPKTKSSRRVVPLPSWAVAALQAHRAALGAVPMPSLPVFTNESGNWVHLGRFYEHWAPLRKAAGLPEDATFHGLRHTTATLLLGGGVDVKTVQGVIGHSRASTTLDIYTDFIPGSASQAMRGLDGLLAEKAEAKG